MSTLSPPPRTIRARSVAKAAPASTNPGPHLPEPTAGPTVRDRASLFNFKSKPGYYNAAAQAALLRRDKHAPHDELFVDFAGPQVLIELIGQGQPLVQGPWSTHAVAGGQTLAAAGPWSEVCWHREDLCDYLEIELPLSGGWRLERHMLLARKDCFLFVADALLGPQRSPGVEIAYSQSLTLAQTVRSEGARETRDAALQCKGRRQSTVLPLALGEWRAEHCHAELTGDSNQLTLRQAAHGRNLFSPLWFDLDPRRVKRPATWRRLSVGENLGVVPRDIAVGYRIQAGDEQWLLYRSLTPQGNRSILGHNTAYSFVCGRIKKDGSLAPLIEIE